MIREIENRRSIRKYKPDEIERKLIDEIIYSASLAPSAKNRQPWKFIVYQGKEKDKLVDVMRHGINSEKMTHELMPEWAFAIPDAENTVRIMQEAPCLIAVLNTNQHTPFASIENEKQVLAIHKVPNPYPVAVRIIFSIAAPMDSESQISTISFSFSILANGVC